METEVKEPIKIETQKPKKEKVSKYAWLLIIMCWLVYSCSYLGKVNYAANINQIMEFYKVSHAEAGLVSTFLFFSYAAGQIFNGIFCKKYNVPVMVFISMAVSGSINLAVAFAPNFAIVKYLWLVNGFSLSILWPSLIRLLAESISKKNMTKAVMMMGTTVALGTFTIYGLSAIFATFNAFKLAFIVAGSVMITVGVIWIFVVPKTVKRAIEEESENEAEEQKIAATQDTGKLAKKLIYLSIVLLAFYGIATNLIKDGLTTWVPSILKENYNLGESLSIILTLALPVVSIFGNAFAVRVHKTLPDFVYQCALFFAVSGAIIGGVIAGLALNQFVLTLVGFTVVCFLVSASNSTITSIFPLFMKGKVNSGFIAGILNGFCYVGSTASSYGLGLVADHFGWTSVFWLLLSVCVIVAVFAVIYGIIKSAMQKAHRESH